uniref:Uncharacterized protein n=1 Tax=Cyanothece sp. (strain PCC 7425 / ATCC 29141) TaxID=395961 RepID=B8HW83_CYAP4
MTTESPSSTLPETETTATTSTGDEFNQVQEATKALVEALKNLATAQFKAVEDQVQTVSTLPQNVLAGIEAAIKDLQARADANWQQMSKQVTDLEERLSCAAKAAWDAIATPSASSETPDVTVSAETAPDTLPDQDT